MRIFTNIEYMNTNFHSVDEYIATFPDDIQKLLRQMRKIIQDIVPEAEEVISYAMPTFKLNGKNLVHFAGFTNHIGFFPTPSGVEAYKNEIKHLKTSKGTIQFSLDEPLPVDLIKKIVKFRKEELLSKTKSKY